MDLFDAMKTYLVTCSESLILGHGQGLDHEQKVTDPQQIVMVKLSRLLLKNLENMGCCRSLRICILSDNFITRIDALIECVHIVKLDLKGNQITQLPDAVFWDRLQQLQLLHLHDNNMGTRKNIQGLAGCPNLTALTLHDTPLSLKGNYRHCIVNSIWSLKALDNYVISDDEIIENWDLPLIFKSPNPHFFLNLYPSSKTRSYQSEMGSVRKIISEINSIQAVYSPTLIIQRWFRGHLTRKRLGLVRAVPNRRRLRYLLPIPSVGADGENTARSKKTQGDSWVKESMADQYVQMLEERNVKIKKLYVDLKQLVQTGSPEILQEETSLPALEAKKQKDFSPLYNTPQLSKRIWPSKMKHIEIEVTTQNELYEKELGKISFRVHGFKALFHLAEPVTDMLISRRQGGQDIRKAIRHFHKQQPEPPKLPQPRPLMITAEKRLMVRCHGSISLAPFQVIERAYRVRQQAEELTRAKQVTQSQAQREAGQGQRDGLLEAHRKVQKRELREQERAQVKSALALLKASRDREVQAARQRYACFLEEKRRRATERVLVNIFSGKHSSLTKAISQQNTRKMENVAQQDRSDMVSNRKIEAKSQKKFIQGCREDRNQSMKDEAITSRINRNTYLATKHNYQLIQAQARVANRRAGPAKMEVMEPVPVNQTA